ncbi:MAG: F0F1 ATP synthase subunit alpha [Kiritimatiellaeota bacterium]|nr:F0F1 ATP synthase subunit alpha [Kiritimatiellota bacterium]
MPTTPLKPGEIVALLKKEIDGFSHLTEIHEVGTIIQCGDGVARACGLDDIMSSELVEIDLPDKDPVVGMAINLEEDNVGIVLFDGWEDVGEGAVVRRTKSVAGVPTGDSLSGRVVDALGRPLDEGAPLLDTERRDIEIRAPGIVDRKNVVTPLQTGLKAVDSMIPIGRGQRELIIGDRGTGKTAIALDAIINQGLHFDTDPVYCFYVAIGQKRSSVARVIEQLKSHDAMRYTTVISATAGEAATMQYIAPYSAMAMAEYFRDNGKHALVIFDDLTKHAQSYRQISLLLRRPPGREAFPGDIFYLHSRLLERAAAMSEAAGCGTLTALPIVETQDSAYVPTNIISITDGQIFLEGNLFNSGIRPAVNVGISVSRVGGDAQIKAMKQTSGTLRLDLAQFRELASFSQFSSDLDPATQALLDRGERLVEILKQRQFAPMPVELQILSIYAGTHGWFDDMPTRKISGWESHFHEFVLENHPGFFAEFSHKGEFTEESTKKLDAILAEFAEKVNIEEFSEEFDAGYNINMALALATAGRGINKDMLKLVERVTARELASPALEDELVQIMTEPEEEDEERDHFDKLIENAPVLDFEDSLTVDDAFAEAAEILAEKLDGIDASTVLAELLKREKQSPTALNSFIAVPHFILKGENQFQVLLMRCRKGIEFSDVAPTIHFSFFMAGTVDMRPLHLRALAAIAQVVQDPSFEKSWLGAENTEELRKLVRYGKRKRDD